MATFKVTIRQEGKTERFQRDALAPALDLLEFELRALSGSSRREPASGIARQYEPGEIVAVRGEVAGRGVRAGVDVRGDGSSEAFTGRLRRSLIRAQDGESPYDALRRVLRV